jgi:hypothetical protein
LVDGVSAIDPAGVDGQEGHTQSFRDLNHHEKIQCVAPFFNLRRPRANPPPPQSHPLLLYSPHTDSTKSPQRGRHDHNACHH